MNAYLTIHCQRSQRYISFKMLAIFLILCLSVLSFFPTTDTSSQVHAAGTVFSNASTVESGVKALFQNAFNNMLCKPDGSQPVPEIEFTVSGVEAAKVFLETDAHGNIAYDPGSDSKFTAKSTLTSFFEEQIISMTNNNYNAYARFALKSYEVSIGMSYYVNNSNVVTDMDLFISYNLIWHDGNNPLGARNAVIADVHQFLNSTAYTSKTTDYDKMKAINSYICNRFQYDYRLFIEAEKDQAIYSAYKMITDTGGIGGYPRGVCQAYSMYGYIMLKEAGYPAVTIDGNAGGGLHAWNMVQIGANWYHNDYTWDDPIDGGLQRQKGAGTVSVNYLLRSDSEIDINHTWKKTQNGYTYPVATAKWGGTPTIINVTQPNPEPTSTPVPSVPPTIPITATPTSSVSSKPASSSQSYSKSSSVSTSSAASSKGGASSGQSANITIKQSVQSGSQGDQPALSTGSSSEAQTMTITGKLLDGNEKPVPGRILELFSTGQTVITDEEGNYTFQHVKTGSYKIYLRDENGKEIAELPIIITPGNKTAQANGSVQVSGNHLVMDLSFSNNKLAIHSISSSRFMLDRNTLIGIAAATAGVLLILVLIYLFRKKKEKDWN